ncbi:MAG: phenylalanine--tRNA ligase subunit beta [Thermodesulfobacteriota bacterium]
MKATLSWIQEFVSIEGMEARELAEGLTHRGLECSASLEGSLDGIVVAEVLEVTPHPQADRLKLCRVKGGLEILNVVCGAPNVRAGVKVPLARVGAKLPNGAHISATRIRGVLSEGMLCSEAELQLGDDASGIWILPDHLEPGDRLDEALRLKDWVLSLDVTPNRADCLSVLGLAFEVAALVGGRVRPPKIQLRETAPAISNRFQVEIRDPDLCPRYVARMVEALEIAPSPLWMRRRLQLVGLRPINNVVDITNYVMWELGQPLHAFDLDLLEGSRIVVQRARPGERFVSLDGQLRVLSEDMLMIWDGARPVAVAGVMGGQNSEVRPQTRNVLIESAYFQPMNIRRTSKALGMNTEASRRFERGVDPEGCPRAADRAAQLMAELAGGAVAAGILDVYPRPQVSQPIRLRISRTNELLGTDLTLEEVRRTLEVLSMEVKEGEGGSLLVVPPTRRVDLTREIDLVEEVARVWGFERIPSSLPGRTGAGVEETAQRGIEGKVRETLVGLGFHEAITFSFIDPMAMDRLGLAPLDRLRTALELRNPIRQDQRIMRTTLVPGLLDAVHRNLHRRTMDLRLFELGRVFLPKEGQLLPEEPRRVAGAMLGQRAPQHWSYPSSPVDFFDLKGVVETLLEAVHLKDVCFDSENPPVFLRRSAAARILSGHRELGWLGELHPEVLEKWDLESPVFLFEMDLEELVEPFSRVPVFKPLPRFPEVVRDLSVVVGEDVPGGDVLRCIREMGLEWLESVVLYDLFRDPEKLPPGTKSLTFRIWYRSKEGSLTDEAVNQEQQRLVDGLARAFGARLRA